jgi:hypothetical protein
MAKQQAYVRIIEHIFLSKFKPDSRTVDFEREDIVESARHLGIRLPRNLGDVIYSFRYRAVLPDSIQRRAPSGKAWIIRGTGIAKYRFVLVPNVPLIPRSDLAETKIPDATPGVVTKYALSDEQALLAKLRYNRLIDIFTGVTCYSLQNHLRTSVPEIGQVETDELYVGLDKRGAHYVIPVQAKGGKDRLSVVQIEQDMAICAAKFASAICRPVAAQFMRDDVIALFEFEQLADRGATPSIERHYRLVSPEEITPADLATYQRRREE